MKLLDYTGLQKLVEKLKLFFYKKSDFDSTINKVRWIGDFFPEYYNEFFEVNKYFIDGMTESNTEIIIELCNTAYGNTHHIMDSIRIPLADAMIQTQVVILKSGWNPYGHAGNLETGVVYVFISYAGTVGADIKMGGFPPMLRFYLRKFER